MAKAPAPKAHGSRKGRTAKAVKSSSRSKRPDEPITKTEMYCRPHDKMHPRSAFAPSFIKRRDFRCREAFNSAYAARYAKPKTAKKRAKR